MTNEEKAHQIAWEDKNNAMFSAQKEISERGPFFKTEMAQYAIQLGFDKGVEWKEQQMIEKALQIYLKELVQFNNLLARLNPEYDKLIDVDKSYDDFKRKMKS